MLERVNDPIVVGDVLAAFEEATGGVAGWRQQKLSRDTRKGLVISDQAVG